MMADMKIHHMNDRVVKLSTAYEQACKKAFMTLYRTHMLEYYKEINPNAMWHELENRYQALLARYPNRIHLCELDDLDDSLGEHNLALKTRAYFGMLDPENETRGLYNQRSDYYVFWKMVASELQMETALEQITAERTRDQSLEDIEYIKYGDALPKYLIEEGHVVETSLRAEFMKLGVTYQRCTTIHYQRYH